MGISETILAAMIGAIATVTTACFQLFSVLKSRGKVDVRPKKGSTMRSVLAVLALMVASAGGGFLYSEFLKQRNGEDLRAMREEVREMKQEVRSMTAAATRARDEQSSAQDAAEPVAAMDAAFVNGDDAAAPGHAESVVYVPACRRTTAGGVDAASGACEVADAQRIALCGTIPGYARVFGIDLFAQPDAVQHPWDIHRVSLEQDLGGARFTGKPFEYAQGQELKAVCVNFLQWSSDHPHIARIVIRYGFGETPTLEVKDGSSNEAAAEPAPAAIAAEGGTSLPQAASLTAPAIAR
jgi:hypothetical protein